VRSRAHGASPFHARCAADPSARRCVDGGSGTFPVKRPAYTETGRDGDETLLETPQGANALTQFPRLLPGDEKLHFAMMDFERELRAINESLLAIRTSWFYHDPPDKERARSQAAELNVVLARLRSAVSELQRTMAPLPP